MEYDEKTIDEATLALMYLVTYVDGPSSRAWKGFDWETMERLYDADMISDPRSKAKSVRMTEEGASRSKALFEKLFSVQ